MAARDFPLSNPMGSGVWRYGDTNPFRSARQPHKCPVCEGSGKKHPPLETWGHTTSAAPMPESCHGCSGTGIVWG